jgi:hypothetical protein
MVAPQRAGDDPAGLAPISDTLVWRGPRAPAALPAAESLRGTVQQHLLDSAVLGAPRGVTVYRPPGHQGPLPGCVLADGESARGFAHILEPAILAGTVPPVLLVGVHNAGDPTSRWPDRRAQEYLPGHHRRRFDAHLGFVVDEVIPWATSSRAQPPGRGSPLASPTAAPGRLRPHSAARTCSPRWPLSASAWSRAGSPARPARPAGATTWPPARSSWAFGRRPASGPSTCSAPGSSAATHEWVGGHDHLWWEQQLPAALEWLLG